MTYAAPRHRANIPRERLSDRFDAAVGLPLTVVRAPAGYGKTTAVSDWLASRGRRSSWLSLEVGDNDVENLFPRLLAISADLTGAHGEELSVVLDDYQLLAEPAAHRAVATLLDRLPGGVQAIVISRTQPPLRLGRRRAGGALFEVGSEELAFTDAETATLLGGPFGLELNLAQREEVIAAVGGWPAGLALIAGAVSDNDEAGGFERGLERGRGRVVQYVREEVLEGCAPGLREFLLRASILERLSPALCAAVLDDPRAGELLADARGADLLVAEPDDAHGFARFPDPLGGVLRRELAAREPELVPLLHGRASGWFEEAGMLEEAIDHASRAGDGRRAAALVYQVGDELLDSGRHRGALELIESIPADRGDYGPYCQVLAVLARSLDRANPRLVYEQLRELKALHPDAPGVDRLVGLVLVSPFFGRVSAAAAAGRELLEAASAAPLAERAALAAKLGVVEWFDGCPSSARNLLEGYLDAMVGRRRSLALAGLALATGDGGDLELSLDRAEAALAAAEVGGAGGEIGLEQSFLHQALANGLIVAGRHEDADRALARAEEAAGAVPGSLHDGFSAVLRAELALRRNERGRALRAAARARVAIDTHPDAGALATRLAAVEANVARGVGGELRGTLPTPAEQRVLELLGQGLTFKEVAGDLYVSIHTVKSHSRRLYRRLGVNSRQAAVEVARQRGLLDGGPAEGSAAF